MGPYFLLTVQRNQEQGKRQKKKGAASGAFCKSCMIGLFSVWLIIRRCRKSNGLLRLFLTRLDHHVVPICCDATHALRRATRTRRDQTSDDYVFFQANQLITFTLDRCLGQNTSGFLERRRRDERTGLQRGFGDAILYTKT